MASAVALLVFGGSRAEAHLVTTGLGPVYDGIAHVVLSPADVMLVVVLALMAAMRGARFGRWMLAVLPVAWLVGGVAGQVFPVDASLSWATGLAFLVAGVLVAADRNMPLPVVSTLVAVIGAFQGFQAGGSLAPAASSTLEMTGEWIALTVVATLVAGMVVSFRAFGVRVGVRVVGSWIAATGLLLIGWSLRAGR